MKISNYLWIIPTLIFTILVLFAANMHPLWGDEAETALFARNILKCGVPCGWDGVNIMGNQNGIVLNKDLINHTSPWLQYYLAAGTFKLLGESSFTARLPFVLISILTIPFVYLFTCELTRNKMIAFLTVFILSVSVPFILFSYQARYYSVAILSGIVLAHASLLFYKKNLWPKLLFVFSSVMFFYANYVIFLVFISTIFLTGLGCFIHQKRTIHDIKKYLLYFVLLSAVAAFFELPWFMFMKPFEGQGSLIPLNISQIPQLVLPFSMMLREALSIYSENNALPILFMPVLVWLCFKKKDYFKPFLFTVAAPILFMTVMVLFTMYSKTATFFMEARYTMAIFPFFTIASAIVLYELVKISKYIGTIVLIGFLLTNTLALSTPIRSYFFEFINEAIHPYKTPDIAVANYLAVHAIEGDTAFVNLDRDHEPLLFYLGNKIRFVNRISLTNSRIFPKNRQIIPRYIYDFRDKPDWVILYSKRGSDHTAFTIDYRLLPPNIDLTKDYKETVLPVFFSDTTRPEMYLHSFEKPELSYNDQVFIYALQKKQQ